MAKITLENIYDCYVYGRKVAERNMKMGTAAMQVSKTGMGKGSAQIYLRCVRSLIKGERFTGTVNQLAMSRFLTNILSDYGMDGLRRALESFRLHLEYQNPYQNLEALKILYQEFYEVLK